MTITVSPKPQAQRAPDAMPISGHVREARRRLTWVVAALVVAAVVGFVLADDILAVLREPIIEVAKSKSGAATINYDSLTGAFDLKLKITLYLAIVLSAPIWIYQLMAFIAPALSAKEKRYVFGFAAGVLPLFAAGCAVGVHIFPEMVRLLTSFASPEDSTILQASYYFDFVLKLVLATGVAFILPVFVVMLNLLGVLPATAIAKTWKIWIMGIMIFCALVTPAADLMSMFLIAFFAAIFVGPQNLPVYASRLASAVKQFRTFVQQASTQTEEQLGFSLEPNHMKQQIDQYNLKKIVADALADNPEPVAEEATASTTSTAATSATADTADVQIARPRWEVTGGSSGHPTRRLLVQQQSAQ